MCRTVSIHIPDVGTEFDADAFGARLDEARVNWITLFAKCHHGLSYYPTQAGTVHPLPFTMAGEYCQIVVPEVKSHVMVAFEGV
jgi:hypothetical protein